MPIKGRIDMLTHRHPHAASASRSPAPTSRTIEEIGTQIEARPSVGARARAACSPSGPAEATSSTSSWNRDELARYGLSIDEAQTVVQNAIGGENVRRRSRDASAIR